MRNRIIVNKITCKKCGDVIESTYTHDYKTCKCGAVAVDGGHSYLRRCFRGDTTPDKYILEMSITEPIVETEKESEWI